MKKLLTGLILIAIGLTSFGQVDTVEIATLRQSEKGGRAATRIQNANDLLLESRLDSLGNIINPADSTITATTITADSIVTRVLDYSPPHGVMVFSDSAVTLDLTQNIWAKVTNDYDSLYAIIEADGILVDGDSMTIVTPGDYLMLVTMSFDGNAQDNYHMAIYVNSVITRFESHRKTSNNDTGYFGINGYLDNLAAGDDVCLKIRNTINNNDPTFISSQIIMEMSHPR